MPIYIYIYIWTSKSLKKNKLFLQGNARLEKRLNKTLLRNNQIILPYSMRICIKEKSIWNGITSTSGYIGYKTIRVNFLIVREWTIFCYHLNKLVAQKTVKIFLSLYPRSFSRQIVNMWNMVGTAALRLLLHHRALLVSPSPPKLLITCWAEA